MPVRDGGRELKASSSLDPWQATDSLSGIGPKLRSTLEEHGVTRVVDLLLHIPRRYEDRSQRWTLDTNPEPDTWVLVWGNVTVTSVRRMRRRGMKIVDGIVDDGHGRFPVVWFNQPWIDTRLADAGELSLYGPIRKGRGGKIQLVNPEVNDLEDGGEERIVPVYGRLGPLGGRRLRKLMEQSMSTLQKCEDPVPADLRQEFDLPGLMDALGELHHPVLPAKRDEADGLVRALCRHRTRSHRRLVFDELLAFACGLAQHRDDRSRQMAPMCMGGDSVAQFARQMMPFDLTAAQQRVVDEVASDLKRSHPMARLVQGDVGCGKTVVAALALRLVLESGHQAALMAPTELLAEQHARTMASLFENTAYDVHLLTSSAGDRARVTAGLADGSVRLVVGTHALVQGGVEFKDLGLAVVDEQHRFGVGQRESLRRKGRAPHMLVMTATPIPRTLALTVHGDLDVSIIDQLPPGRKPVTTVVRELSAMPKLYEFLRKEIADGGRVFVVFPKIDSGEGSATPALEARAAEIAAQLEPARIGMVHGRMPREARESVTRRFSDGEIQVLLATTVVEVGVDVPEASVMVIEGADRFGLSQLHQLRGRVGRGDRPSWCVFMVDTETPESARRRLDVLCRTNDGFEIAEADLHLRGPGELTGHQQWGPAGFRFADLLVHQDLVAPVRDIANRLAEEGRLDEIKKSLARYHPISNELPTG